MPVESGVKRLREQEFDWAVEQKRVQILLDTTVSSAANATNESGVEAEIAGGVGVRRGDAAKRISRLSRRESVVTTFSGDFCPATEGRFRRSGARLSLR